MWSVNTYINQVEIDVVACSYDVERFLIICEATLDFQAVVKVAGSGIVGTPTTPKPESLLSCRNVTSRLRLMSVVLSPNFGHSLIGCHFSSLSRSLSPVKVPSLDYSQQLRIFFIRKNHLDSIPPPSSFQDFTIIPAVQMFRFSHPLGKNNGACGTMWVLLQMNSNTLPVLT